MKRNANTTAATKAAVAQHTTTERKSAERSTTMRNANTTAAKAAVATKPMNIDADTGWKFTPASIALNGHVFDADKYAVADKGDVYVLAKVEGVALRIHVGKASPVYHEALEAAVAYKAKADKPAETKPAPVAQETKPAPAKKPAKAKADKPAETKPAPVAQAAEPAPAKKPAKAAKAKAAEPKPAPVAQAAEPAPAKKPAKAKADKPAEPKPAAPAMPADNAWIGTTIEGKGWRIAFDEAAQRTRVIVDDNVPNEERVLIAVADAGFFWSNTTKSWNKKLTRKAYRAAQALAETLNAIK